MLENIASMETLVLDDFGVGRNGSDFVLENLYFLIDRWHRNLKKGLIITSNKSLEDIGKIDDRLSSRIAGMCRIVEVKGADGRLK